MDFLNELLEQKGGELIGGLVRNAGFEANEAEGFMPKAVSALVEVVQGGGVDLGSLLSGDGVAALVSQLDLSKLAGLTGVDEGKASAGLETLIPTVLQSLQGESGGAGALLSKLGGEGSEGGSALGGLGKLAGNLFKK